MMNGYMLKLFGKCLLGSAAVAGTSMLAGIGAAKLADAISRKRFAKKIDKMVKEAEKEAERAKYGNVIEVDFTIKKVEDAMKK